MGGQSSAGRAGPDSIRGRLEAALAGEPVARPVLAVYDWFVNHRQIDWPALFRLDLGRINHADVVEHRRPHLEVVETTSQAGGRLRRDVRWVTDAGELHEWYLDEWRQEHLVKSPQDYRVIARALSDVSLTPSAAHFERLEAEVADGGLTVGQLDRTPLQKIQIDFAGLERFSLDLADEAPELMELIELMNDLKLREFRAALETPARQIKLWENLSIETLGPTRYRRHLVPLYEQIFALLDGTGRKLQVHYDGQLSAIAGDVARLPFDGLDSLTPPPEGDMTTAEARRRWPDKFLWLHPSLTWYRLPAQELAGLVRQMVRDAGPRRFCLMISEEVPPDWQRTVPLVLEALESR